MRTIARNAKFITLATLLAAPPITAQAATTGDIALPLAALGLVAADGNTTLKDGGGKPEGTLLLRPLLREAAKAIRAQLAKTDAVLPGTYIVPVTRLTDFDPAAANFFRTRLALIGKSIAATKASCDPASDAPLDLALTGAKAPAIDTSPVALATTVLSLLKTDKTYGAVALDSIDALVLDTLTSTSRLTAPSDPTVPYDKTVKWFIPGSPRLFGDPKLADASSGQNVFVGELSKSFASLTAARATCANPKIAKATAAAAKTGLDNAQAELSALVKRGDKGEASPIEQAMAYAELKPDNTLVLEVHVTNPGSSTLATKNVWTTLGAPALSIASTAVISYRLIDPKDGTVKVGDALFCTTRRVRFGKIVDELSAPASAAVCKPLDG